MTKFGGWNVKFNKNFPQRIASALGKLNELCGCGYEPIAYLADQQVNGINHAVLLEQTVFNGRDSKNAVIAVFNEQPNVIDVSTIDIHRIVESGGALGGTKIEMTLDIPEEAATAFAEQFNGFTGGSVNALVYIGSKMAKGINYIYIAEYKATVLDAVSELVLITVSPLEKRANFERVFDYGVNDTATLGYAFTWLRA